MILLVILFLSVFSQTEWVVELKDGINPTSYAHERGLTYVGPTELNENYHVFKTNHKSRMLTRAEMTRDTVWAEEQVERIRFKREVDPLRGEQWHLGVVGLPTVTTPTGLGVTIGIVDDGLQHVHPEIYKNYDSHHSWNFNGGPHGNQDPSPTDSQDGHGTSAAAVAAAVKGNGHCGQGVAPDAKLAGIRLIAKPVSDLQESMALSKYFATIDIYSNSWGPADTGQGLDAPGRLVRETLAKFAGANIGRNGKGTIYVWASGNGRHMKDSCAFDGYAGNPYVNAIGAIDYNGNQAYYSEGCSNLLAVTPSSGVPTHGIVTADLLGDSGYAEGECTKNFGGTSSAAPLAAGIIALMLEKRPDLGWRDVRHVIAKACGGNNHNNTHGFGVMNVTRILQTLESHVNVPRKQKQIFTGPIEYDNRVIGNRLEVDIVFNNTSEFVFVENAILTISVSHPRRGRLRISLVSPDGKITSVLAEERDDVNANFDNWSFSSLAFWGMTNGLNTTWKVVFENGGSPTLGGRLHSLNFGLFGY
jgi:hypothetical protein